MKKQKVAKWILGTAATVAVLFAGALVFMPDKVTQTNKAIAETIVGTNKDMGQTVIDANKNIVKNAIDGTNKLKDEVADAVK